MARKQDGPTLLSDSACQVLHVQADTIPPPAERPRPELGRGIPWYAVGSQRSAQRSTGPLGGVRGTSESTNSGRDRVSGPAHMCMVFSRAVFARRCERHRLGIGSLPPAAISRLLVAPVADADVVWGCEGSPQPIRASHVGVEEGAVHDALRRSRRVKVYLPLCHHRLVG